MYPIFLLIDIAYLTYNLLFNPINTKLERTPDISLSMYKFKIYFVIVNIL